MTAQEERIQIFEATRQLYESDPALKNAIQQSVRGQQIIWEIDSPTIPTFQYQEPARLLLCSERSIKAAEKYAKSGKKVAVLNFASSVVPGGGVLKGSNAQEEGICRITTLYPAISDLSASEFYRQHKTLAAEGGLNGKNTDDCIYTPGVVAIREDSHDCRFLGAEERYSFDMITCAAPDQRHHTTVPDYKPAEKELYLCFLQRIRRILQVAAMNQVEVLILGAFGCGAFGNDPEIVSRAFYDAFQSDGNLFRFETVEFAIPFNENAPDRYLAFAKIPQILCCDSNS